MTVKAAFCRIRNCTRGLADSEDFYDHALSSLTIELGIEDALPGTEVEATIRHRKRCLMVEQ
jgi:hypothetical protein